MKKQGKSNKKVAARALLAVLASGLVISANAQGEADVTGSAGSNTSTAASRQASETDMTADVYALNPYVVTATRTPMTLSKVPANVTVVEGDALRASHTTDLSQALRNVPGVTIGNYGTGVGYENSNRFYINGSNSVIWMVDGVVMNPAGVNAPLVALKNMDNIERIEVLKGAASALYGSSAVGGVVNIITKKPAEGIRTKVRVMGGSYNQEQYAILNEGNEEGWIWRASYQKDLMGNYRDAHDLTVPQHLNSHTASFMLGRDIDQNNNLTIYYDSYRANEMYSDSNKHLDTIRYGSASYDTGRAILKSKITENLSNTFSVMNSRYKTVYGGYPLDVQTRNAADQLTYTGAKNQTIIGGFDWRQDKVNTMGGRKLTNMSYYIQDAWQFAPKWTLTPGIRLDHHSAFGSHTSPHVALSYAPNDKTSMYVSYNSFFVAPTPSQLYSGYYGNSALRPETGHEWELGMTHQFTDTMTGGVHFFTRKSTNKIGFDYDTYRYANISEEKAHGISLDLAKQFTPEFSGRIGYTYTHVDANADRALNVDGYIPKHAVTIGLDYVKPKWDAHLDVRGIIDRPGPQTADAYADFFPKKTYWITDVSANYHVSDRMTVFGRVGNLFNVFYAENSNARGQWYGDPGEWWTAPGRNFQVGMEVTF